MKPTLLLISGWAFTDEPTMLIKKNLANYFEITFLTGIDAIQKNDLGNFEYIIAISLGAITAIEKFPSSCKKMILISGTCCFCNKDDYLCGTNQKVLIQMQNEIKKDKNKVLKAFYKNAHSPNKLIPKKSSEIFYTELLNLGLEYMIITDVRENLVDIQIPILIIHGDKDKIIPLSAAIWLHKNLPKSKIECLENSGHMIIYHSIEKIIEMSKDFLISHNE